MSYDLARNYKKAANSTESVAHDQSLYTSGLDYTTIQGAYGTYNANSVPEVNKEYYGYGGNVYNDTYATVQGSYPRHNSGTTVSSTKYGDYKASLKRKFVDLSSIRNKKPEAIPEYDETGKLAMFMGRDGTYPDALNALIHPAQCDLCNMKMNSITSAKDHYESKSHDKNITQWLKKNYTDKGIPAPEVQRFYKQGPAGPDAFYCEFCDLKLTSLTHADQHYSGKRHRLVVSQRGKPSGVGYYNNEGKWVRVSSKLVPQSKNSRFGIGEQFKFMEIMNNADTTTATANADTTTENEITALKPSKICKIEEKDPTLFCAVCRVSVTSALQMTMHLSGTKHQKKLKASGVEVTNTGHPAPSSTTDASSLISATTPVSDNVLNSVIKEENPDPTDLSMYRTPSGQYYCQTCNLTITNLHALEQHLIGKRHLKSQVEQKAMAALAGINTNKLANAKN